jgi:hypothetical protein
MSDERKIIQIIQTTDWYALYRSAQTPGGLVTKRLLAWALIDESGEQTLIGLVVGDEPRVTFADRYKIPLTGYHDARPPYHSSI